MEKQNASRSYVSTLISFEHFIIKSKMHKIKRVKVLNVTWPYSVPVSLQTQWRGQPKGWAPNHQIICVHWGSSSSNIAVLLLHYTKVLLLADHTFVYAVTVTFSK